MKYVDFLDFFNSNSYCVLEVRILCSSVEVDFCDFPDSVTYTLSTPFDYDDTLSDCWKRLCDLFVDFIN